MLEYKVVTALDEGDLERGVKELSKAGWLLTGGVSVVVVKGTENKDVYKFYQAIFREARE